MKHIEKAIEVNTLTLELKKARFQTVLNKTTSRTSHHQPQPDVVKATNSRMTTTNSTLQSNRIFKKRKKPTEKENPTKVQKTMDHFLVKRHKSTSTIT